MRYIIVALLATIISAAAFHPGADFSVHGFILDISGAPIPNATVCVKGTKSCTTTAQDGSFSLKINSKKARLSVVALGYDRKEIQIIEDGKSMVVKMNASTQHLEEEVVAVSDDALAAPRKTSTGAVGAVGRKAIGNSAPLNTTNFYYEKDKKFDSGVPFNTEEYDGITENRFLLADNTPLSTFSIDVDGASYANARRFLDMGQLPPPGSVRIEEFINYFHYDYPQPKAEDPFSINTEIVDCPWQPQNKLVMIGLQGRKIPTDHLPASNLVFLIDVSGSMEEPNKLPLVKASLKLLVDQLREKDRVSLVVYAGNAGLVLPSTPGDEGEKIKDAIDRLEAGGSTAGGAGIQLAYKVAKQNFVREGNNRVILCTDGDFNVGASSDASLEEMIEKERKSGVYLTVLGFGMGNYKDSKMQKLADKGNGNHSYIDNLNEARKVLVSEFGGTLFTIAKDVKLQVEFNPAKVKAYRLIGYENRILNKEDFNNDQKDAGDLGSGHTVTALYEIVPVGVESRFIEKTDPLKYQKKNASAVVSEGNEILTIKFRYKKPDEDVSKLIEHPVIDQQLSLANASDNFRFASAVAEFGMLLRDSEFKEQSNFDDVSSMAKKGLGADEEGYRAQFLSLVRNAASLVKNNPSKEKLVSNGRQSK